MRKITKDAVHAFLNRKPFSRSNTKVKVLEEGVCALLLHNNTIAILNTDGRLTVTNAGWSSNVTKERLNGLPGVGVYQKNYEWYLNGSPWDGRWITLDKEIL